MTLTQLGGLLAVERATLNVTYKKRTDMFWVRIKKKGKDQEAVRAGDCKLEDAIQRALDQLKGSP